MSYPVNFDVEQADERNRLTVFFRIILAIPHILLVGGPLVPSIGFYTATGGRWEADWDWGAWGGNGVLSIAVGVTVFISWFAILFTGRYPDGLFRFGTFYLTWRAKALAYISIMRDEYPPFGADEAGTYPAAFDVPELIQPRDRVSVLFRLFLLIPHVFVLFLVSFVYWAASIVAWFAVLFTGRVPDGIFRFMVGYVRYSLRVEAYAMLLTDQFTPFNNWGEERQPAPAAV